MKTSFYKLVLQGWVKFKFYFLKMVLESILGLNILCMFNACNNIKIKVMKKRKKKKND